MGRKNILIWAIVIIIVLLIGYQFGPWATQPVDDIQVVDEVTETVIDVGLINNEVLSGQAVLLDVRRDDELAEFGYAIGSTHFDLALLEAGELPDFDKNLRVYTYCKAGGRAEKAKVILENNGFVDVINIGGLVDWESAGGVVVK